jgi:hypothetical protein
VGHGIETKMPHTTHLHDIARSVTILRERHPFEGRSLVVMSAIKRRGMRLSGGCHLRISALLRTPSIHLRQRAMVAPTPEALVQNTPICSAWR